MFRTSIRYLTFLFCGPLACTICLLTCVSGTQVAQAAQAAPARQRTAALPQETPTPTASNATVTIMQPGSNGGTMGGHPGTRVQVTGNGFQPGSSVNIYTTTDTTKCTADNAGNLQPFNPHTVTASGNGTFQINAKWPASSGQPGTYSICAVDAATTNATVSSTSFTVVADVTVATTTQSANPGDKVTITGSNWLPPQQLAVSITSSQGANSIVSGQTKSDANGNFSIELTIPQGAQAGSYGVSVVAVNEQSLNAYKDNIITINASTQATPTAAATPSPTASPTAVTTVTPVPTPTAVASGGGSGTGGSSIPPLTLLIFTLGGLGILLVIVGLIMFVSYSKTG